MDMHEGQVTISVEQVRALIADQAPQWASCAVTAVPHAGTVNALFRIGDRLAGRFPLRVDEAPAAAQLATEQAAMAEFARACPVPAPEMLLIGRPEHGYPASWSVQTWISGETPTPTSLEHSTRLPLDVATVISALRQWDAAGRTFKGSNRGGRLEDHDAWVSECISQSEGLADTGAMRRLWARFRALPRKDADVMTHTDLIPGNLLVEGDRLTGVIDSGGFQAADPALDLVAAWHLFEEDARTVLREQLQCDDLQWERGMAWAFEQAAGLIWYYRLSNPPMAHLGETTLRRIIAADARRNAEGTAPR